MKKRKDAKVIALKKYENYLQTVIRDRTEEYSDVKDLRTRYENLI